MKSFWLKVFGGLVGTLLLVAFAPGVSMAQTHIWIDVPGGNVYSETLPSPPAVTVENFDMVEDTVQADLTESSFHSPSDSSTTAEPDWMSEFVEVKVDIPEAGDWWLYAHYLTPTVGVNSFFVVDSREMYIGAASGPSPDPVPFLDVDSPPTGGAWAWGGAPLGHLDAGEYVIDFWKRECVWGTSGEAAKPEENPHIELIFLTNGGPDDLPSNALFNTTQPFTAERSFSPLGYTRFGGPITVDITVTPGTITGNPPVTVTETLPRGFTPENITTSSGTASFQRAARTLTWEIPSLAGEEKMSYTIEVAGGYTEPIVLAGRITGGGADRRVSGLSQIELISFRIIETFSYPLNWEANENAGKSLADVDQQRGWGWSDGWKVGEGVNNALDTRVVDAGLVESQPLANAPGNFSLRLTGASGDFGVRRPFSPVSIGEAWLSFTFLDEGPAANHWAGVSFFDSEGNEVSFVGKPFNAQYAGIGNLPGGDSLATGVDYTQPHHYVVRYLLREGPGQNDGVFLWIDPDKDDRLDTYDAGGDNIDEITNLATLRFARGEGSGSSYLDNIWIDSVPALPPPGAGRVDLTLDDPNRPEEIPAWDSISIDSFDDAPAGWWGFGHDTGEDHYLVVTGFIYVDNPNNPTTQFVAYGLPLDHISGLNGHVLGSYNNAALELNLKNSIKFENTDEQYGPFTFDVVPPGNYEELRACMTVGNGDGEIFATFNYEDGTTTEGVFHADDWYDDPPGLQFPDVFQLVNDMNRLAGGQSTFDARFDPAFFDNPAPVDSTKVLVSVTLEYNPAVDGSNAINVYDILAVPPAAAPPVGVQLWMLM